MQGNEDTLKSDTFDFEKHSSNVKMFYNSIIEH